MGMLQTLLTHRFITGRDLTSKQTTCTLDNLHAHVYCYFLMYDSITLIKVTFRMLEKKVTVIAECVKVIRMRQI